MSVETNKAVAQQFYAEVFSAGNLNLIDELFAVTFVDRDPGNPFQSREGLKQFVSMYRGAYPDLHITIEDMIAEGDKLVVRFIARGTHKGTLMGIPPTGRQVTVTGIDILRFEDGKMAEHWGNQDILGMMQQLGVIPALGQ